MSACTAYGYACGTSATTRREYFALTVRLLTAYRTGLTSYLGWETLIRPMSDACGCTVRPPEGGTDTLRVWLRHAAQTRSVGVSLTQPKGSALAPQRSGTIMTIDE